LKGEKMAKREFFPKSDKFTVKSDRYPKKIYKETTKDWTTTGLWGGSKDTGKRLIKPGRKGK